MINHNFFLQHIWTWYILNLASMKKQKPKSKQMCSIESHNVLLKEYKKYNEKLMAAKSYMT